MNSPLNYIILIFCISVGYLCSLTGNINFNQKREISNIEQIRDILLEWKNYDIGGF